jgi:RNA polymerase sigma-70 factor, ECF subfamily
MSTAPTTATAQERELLEAARDGDEGAFQRLIERYQSELHAHCYRMLGSLHDAEDALQEALVRAWRGLARFEGRSSLRSWLYRIATNTCLDAIAKRPKRVLPVDYGPASDPHDGPGEPIVESVWVEPYPDETLGVEDGYAAPEASYEQREAVELAFIAALQHLPGRQRAVLVLRDVLAFRANEVAGLLGTTTAAVNSLLQRARAQLANVAPEELVEPSEPQRQELLDQYAKAFETADIGALLHVLTQDAVLEMPPQPGWFQGRENVCRFLAGRLTAPDAIRLKPTAANGQPAFGLYSNGNAYAVQLITVTKAGISRIDMFHDPGLVAKFGLPATC